MSARIGQPRDYHRTLCRAAHAVRFFLPGDLKNENALQNMQSVRRENSFTNQRFCKNNQWRECETMMNAAAREAWDDYLLERDPQAQEMAYQRYIHALLRSSEDREKELDDHAAQLPIGAGQA